MGLGGDVLKYDMNFYPDKVAVIALHGELSSSTIEVVRNKVSQLILQGDIETLIWDFQQVRFMDSTAIGLILGRMKELRIVNGRTLLINANSTMKKIFTLSGLAPFLYDGTELEALAYVGGKLYG